MRGRPEGSPEAALACAVIRNAVLEANGRFIGSEIKAPERIVMRADARQFLAAGSADMEFWADVAGLDPETLLQAVEANGRQFSDEYRARDVRR